MNTKKIFSLNAVVTAIFALVAYWLLAMKNGFMLRWYDEMSLFEPTRIFFSQFINYPGGLLRWAGTWLTQLMYHPWLGTMVLVALWLLLSWITSKAFRLSKAAAPLALLVPATLLVSVAQLDEAWLTLKTPGYIYSNTLGYIFTVSIIWLYRHACGRLSYSIPVVVLATLCYPFAGFYALLGTGLCVVWDIIQAISEKKHIHLVTAAVGVLMIAVIPPLYYTYWHGTTVDNDYLYLKGLPELMIDALDIYLWIPFIIATVVLLLMDILSGMGWIAESKWVKWVSIAGVCCGLIWGITASKKSEQLRATVLMVKRLENNDWMGMSLIMSRIKEPPNYTMRLLHNVALANQGYEGEDLSGLSPAAGDGRHSEKFTISAFVQVPVYYQIGRHNESYRWAMEHTVQYGKRVFFLKYMVKTSLLRGETQLARRYNDILKSTMFHRKWAEDMETYINNPELIKENAEFQRIMNAK